MRVKNDSGSSQVWVGQTIADQSEYNISASDIFKWQSDDKVIEDLSTLDLLIGDGTSYKSSANEAVNFLIGTDTDPRDSSGRKFTRTAIASEGSHYQPHWLEFKTSQLDSIYNHDEDENDLGFSSLKCFNANGDEITVQSEADTDAVKTQIDWMPTHDFEMIAGQIFQAGPPEQDVRLWVIGLPDISNIKFSQGGINLALLGTGAAADTDGRSSVYLKYNNPVDGTNKFRIILKHPTGFKHRAALLFEIYKIP